MLALIEFRMCRKQAEIVLREMDVKKSHVRNRHRFGNYKTSGALRK